MKTLLVGLGAVATSLLVGCMDEGEVEDGENDVFMTDDAKADAFGVEDWSPDGAAVLKYVTSATVSKLETDVGLSNRVAKAIVAQRNTLPGKKYTDLEQLDDAKYVGTTVFKQLLTYAAEHKLFKTSIRIPLVVVDANEVSLTSFNDKARQAGVSGFARYTFVDATTDYSAKMDSYDARLATIATKLHITIDGEMKRYASTVSEYAVGSVKPCYIGDGSEVPDVTSSQGDSLMGDMYSLWGYRYRSTKWIYDDQDEADMNFGSEWNSWSTSSKSVLMMSTNTDSGDEPEADIVPPCR